MLEETEDDELIAELERKVAELQDTVNNQPLSVKEVEFLKNNIQQNK